MSITPFASAASHRHPNAATASAELAFCVFVLLTPCQHSGMKTFAHYARVLCGMDLPYTDTSAAERAMLCTYAVGRKRIVEIGVAEGFTTRLLAEAADRDALIYGIDPFFRGRIGISWSLRIAKFQLRDHLASGKVKLIRTFSTQVGNAVPSTVDYVFVDGDHSLYGIIADWAFWTARLQSGGIIALHDVLGAQRFGSHRYFNTHIQNDHRFKIIDQQDSLAVLTKH
jgi:predicted O-methyltransferase YrrM